MRSMPTAEFDRADLKVIECSRVISDSLYLIVNGDSQNMAQRIVKDSANIRHACSKVTFLMVRLAPL